MTRRSLWLATMLAFGALLPACAYFGGQTEPLRPPLEAQAATPDRGRVLYMRDCAWCHGDRGQGTRRGPDLTTGTNGPALTDFELSTGRMPINQPDDNVVRKEPVYTSSEIRDIVDFVASFGQPGPDIPEVHASEAELHRGAELYQENCAACHATTGIGGALAAGRVDDLPQPRAQTPGLIAPSVRESTPKEVAEAMIAGPGNMPVFGPPTFSKEDVDAVVRYVAYLQEPESPGGMGIGGVGPVTEGAVGWLVGLGALLVLIRWIGTRAGED